MLPLQQPVLLNLPLLANVNAISPVFRTSDPVPANAGKLAGCTSLHRHLQAHTWTSQADVPMFDPCPHNLHHPATAFTTYRWSDLGWQYDNTFEPLHQAHQPAVGM